MESCLFEDTGRWADVKVVDAGVLQDRPRHVSRSRSFGGSSGSGGAGSTRSMRLNSLDLSRNITESKKGMVRTRMRRRGGGSTILLAWGNAVYELPQVGGRAPICRVALPCLRITVLFVQGPYLTLPYLSGVNVTRVFSPFLFFRKTPT